MALRNLIPFLILVFVVAIAGTYLALQLFPAGRASTGDAEVRLVTVQVIVTATTDPNATPAVRIITATPDRTQVALPADVLSQAQTGAPVATLDLTVIGAASAEVGLTATGLPANCLIHVVVSGDTPFGIAEQYGVSGFRLLEANNLTEQTATGLQIGQSVIVPLEGCEIAAQPTATLTPDPDEPTPTPDSTQAADSVTPAASPTITLPPTAANAQISIVAVENVGDVTAEAVRIRNNGNTVNVTGWVLSDADGNEYVFGQQLIFSNQEVTLYTRLDQNTPIALFWGRDTAVWQSGDVVTLRDAQNRVQASIRVP